MFGECIASRESDEKCSGLAHKYTVLPHTAFNNAVSVCITSLSIELTVLEFAVIKRSVRISQKTLSVEPAILPIPVIIITVGEL